MEIIFAEWNAGSGQESVLFKQSRCRSLSVGDFVKIGNNIYECDSIGWNKVTQQDVDNREQAIADYMKIYPQLSPFAANSYIRRMSLQIKN